MPFGCDNPLVEDQNITQAIGLGRFKSGGYLGNKCELATPGPVYADSIDDLP